MVVCGMGDWGLLSWDVFAVEEGLAGRISGGEKRNLHWLWKA